MIRVMVKAPPTSVLCENRTRKAPGTFCRRSDASDEVTSPWNHLHQKKGTVRKVAKYGG